MSRIYDTDLIDVLANEESTAREDVSDDLNDKYSRGYFDAVRTIIMRLDLTEAVKSRKKLG